MSNESPDMQVEAESRQEVRPILQECNPEEALDAQPLGGGFSHYPGLIQRLQNRRKPRI